MSSTSNGNFASDGFVIVTSPSCATAPSAYLSTLLACTKQAFLQAHVVAVFLHRLNHECTRLECEVQVHNRSLRFNHSPGSKRFSCNDFNTEPSKSEHVEFVQPRFPDSEASSSCRDEAGSPRVEVHEAAHRCEQISLWHFREYTCSCSHPLHITGTKLSCMSCESLCSTCPSSI